MNLYNESLSRNLKKVLGYNTNTGLVVYKFDVSDVSDINFYVANFLVSQRIYIMKSCNE